MYIAHASSLIRLLLLLTVCWSAAAIPRTQTLTLDLPEGESIRFEPIFLGLDGNKPFATRQVTIGKQDGLSEAEKPSYKEQAVSTLLAGSFVAERNGRKDWLYYMGTTEIQQAQWNAVMRWYDQQQGRQSRDKKDSKKPQTGMTLAEIYQFIEALNTWLRTTQKQKLRHLGRGYAFARLPTEVEWEFAARGGMAVLEGKEPDRFERAHPYNNLSHHEWFNETAKNTLMETGDVAEAKPKPNPLGLYDMLGNVEELTLSLFGPDYLQGRLGGYVVRGANYSSRVEDLTAYKRGEYLWLGSSGHPVRNPKIGIRLVLASRISGTWPRSELDAAYQKQYLELGGRTLSRPGPAHTSSPAIQAQQDLLAGLQERNRRLAQQNQYQTERIIQLEQAKREQQGAELGTSRQLTQLEQDNNALHREVRQLRDLLNKPTQPEINPGKITELERRIAQLAAKNTALRDQSTRKEQQIANLDQQLKQKEAALQDAKRKRGFTDYRTDQSRVRAVEKRYLEALMRLASYNAFAAVQDLIRLEMMRRSGRDTSYELYQKKLAAAKRFANDYYRHIKTIVKNTDLSLFSEVRAELDRWYQNGLNGSIDPKQRLTLEHIQQDVTDARNNRLNTQIIWDRFRKRLPLY